MILYSLSCVLFSIMKTIDDIVTVVQNQYFLNFVKIKSECL